MPGEMFLKPEVPKIRVTADHMSKVDPHESAVQDVIFDMHNNNPMALQALMSIGKKAHDEKMVVCFGAMAYQAIEIAAESQNLTLPKITLEDIDKVTVKMSSHSFQSTAVEKLQRENPQLAYLAQFAAEPPSKDPEHIFTAVLYMSELLTY